MADDLGPKPPLPKDITDLLRNVTKGSQQTSMEVASTTLTLIELEHIEICLMKSPGSVDWFTVCASVLSSGLYGLKSLNDKQWDPKGMDLVAVILAFAVMLAILGVNVKKWLAKD